MAKRAPSELFTAAQSGAAQDEIKAKQREVKYDLRDFTIDYIVKEFKDGLFFIPPYQRDFVWDIRRQCRFIESVLLGLPIPMMFVADLDDGRLEVVDGAQRMFTLESFISGDLVLRGLDRLPSLQGFTYADLPESQQRKFGTKALRVVVLEDSTTEETRHEIFDRINTSPMRARPAEVRRGAHPGPFAEFLDACAKDARFRALCPISAMLRARHEDEELLLRFFAYSDRYMLFKHDVEKFLTTFARDHQDQFNVRTMRAEYERMLQFVEEFFPYGFAKAPGHKNTPRVRFEAIAVGTNLALREVPNLRPPSVKAWIGSEEFKKQVTTHASNSGPRLRGRVEFVRDRLLGRDG
ncbi:MAG TPA: DUF262 domain-containing protein [Tepidisphaeraceae bacterium]|jgi:hypothetical protein|nr:DUF262 domain-containing protein [Tepidisphaeraceae bacterium]